MVKEAALGKLFILCAAVTMQFKLAVTLSEAKKIWPPMATYGLKKGRLEPH